MTKRQLDLDCCLYIDDAVDTSKTNRTDELLDAILTVSAARARVNFFAMDAARCCCWSLLVWSGHRQHHHHLLVVVNPNPRMSGRDEMGSTSALLIVVLGLLALCVMAALSPMSGDSHFVPTGQLACLDLVAVDSRGDPLFPGARIWQIRHSVTVSRVGIGAEMCQWRAPLFFWLHRERERDEACLAEWGG